MVTIKRPTKGLKTTAKLTQLSKIENKRKRIKSFEGIYFTFFNYEVL